MATERRRRRLRRTGAARPLATEQPEAAGTVRAQAAGGPSDDAERARAAAPVEPPPRAGAIGAAVHRPSPQDLADLTGAFALTAAVHDPDPAESQPDRGDESAAERGLRGLVGGGSSQVNVRAAMRARDASRPTEADLAAAQAQVVVVRRGWVPREDLPRLGRR